MIKNKIKKALLLLLICCGFVGCANEGKEDNTTAATVNSTNPIITETTTSSAPKSQAQTTAVTTEVYYDNIDASLESFSISEENKFITSPKDFEIDNEKGEIRLNVTYESYVDSYTLQHCILNVSVSGGEYSIIGDGARDDGTFDLTKPTGLILTDKNGKSKKYSILLKREVLDIPVVNINLDNNADINSIDRNQYSQMTFFMDCTGTDEFESSPVVSGKIKGRGHSTWLWEKKPYRIKLDQGCSLLGLHKDKDWILVANYMDKSLIRNCVAYDMGKEIGGFVWNPVGYPVDLFINGEYQGVYSLGEQLEVNKHKINIDQSGDTDCGYLLEVGGVNGRDYTVDYDCFFTDNDLVKFIAFKEPEPENMTEEQKAFIKDFFNKAEKAIISGKGYEEYIDTDSFCDWIIIHELTYNRDSCFRRSCFFTKDKGGKLKLGPIWDFDTAFGNYSADNQYYNNWCTVGYEGENAFVSVNWCNYLMNDPQFRAKLKSRWQQVGDKLVQRAMICIDYYSNKLYKSQQENFKRWQILDKKVGYQPDWIADFNTYELQIEYLKAFIIKRAEWINENI